MTQAMIRWIFFDLGGTLLDDIPFHDYIYKTLIDMFEERGFNVTMEEFLKARNFYVTSRVPILRSLIVYFTGRNDLKEPMMDELMRRIEGKGPELQKPYPEAGEVLKEIKRRFKLGIIANQQVGIRELLKESGWDELFDVIMISDEVRLQKPDATIFENALEMAKCPPTDAVMVGDRIDNDIAPARKMGMKTVRFKAGVFAAQKASGGSETPDAEITSLKQLPSALANLS